MKGYQRYKARIDLDGSICFAAEPIGGTPSTSSESKSVRWVSPEEISELDVHPSIRERIQRGLRPPEEPYFT